MTRVLGAVATMEVRLTTRFALVAHAETVFLLDRGSGAKIRAEDVFQPYPNWGFRPAAEHVMKMALSSMPKPEQQAVIDRYCEGYRSPETTRTARTSARSARIRTIGL